MCDTWYITLLSGRSFELRKCHTLCVFLYLLFCFEVHIFRDGTLVAVLFGPVAIILPEVMRDVLFEAFLIQITLSFKLILDCCRAYNNDFHTYSDT